MELEHRRRLETTIYGPQRAVDCDVNLLHVWASAPDRGTVFSCGEYQGLRGDPQCYRTSIPHKSGNKMKEKKRNNVQT